MKTTLFTLLTGNTAPENLTVTASGAWSLNALAVTAGPEPSSTVLAMLVLPGLLMRREKKTPLPLAFRFILFKGNAPGHPERFLFFRPAAQAYSGLFGQVVLSPFFRKKRSAKSRTGDLPTAISAHTLFAP